MKIASSYHGSTVNTRTSFPLVLILLMIGVSLLPSYFHVTATSFYYCTAFQLSPSTKPGEIVERQLAALQDDDMAAVYKFASPANKEQTGNSANFGKIVRSGPYRYVISWCPAAAWQSTQQRAVPSYTWIWFSMFLTWAKRLLAKDI